MFVWKDENKQKEAGNGPFKKFLNVSTLLDVRQYSNALCSVSIEQRLS